MGTKQVLPIWVRVDMGVMVMKMYSNEKFYLVSYLVRNENVKSTLSEAGSCFGDIILCQSWSFLRTI